MFSGYKYSNTRVDHLIEVLYACIPIHICCNVHLNMLRIYTTSLYIVTETAPGEILYSDWVSIAKTVIYHQLRLCTCTSLASQVVVARAHQAS